MHEVTLAEAIWREVVSEMARRPERRLRGLRVVVGRWSGAERESLEFALGLLVAESEWPDAEILIRDEPLALVCRACSREFEPQELQLACPSCGSAETDVVRGRELRLESLEVE